MNWRLKARLQQAIGQLPEPASRTLYYALQRTVGNLRHPAPLGRLEIAARLARTLEAQGRAVAGKAFLEVGTGHQLNVPIGLYLLGAARVVTVDLNPYLKAALVREDLDYIRSHRSAIAAIFAEVTRPTDFETRLDTLCGLRETRLDDLLCAMSVEYLAPADASKLPLASGCIDFHVSNSVLEHIPREPLAAILVEARRLLTSDGLLVHRVDFSDHFSHGDGRITSVHFLRFDEREWRAYAGNRYAYHNRLRVDDLSAVFDEAALRILALEPEVDPQALALLESGRLPLAAPFAMKPARVNATRNAWVTAAAPEAHR